MGAATSGLGERMGTLIVAILLVVGLKVGLGLRWGPDRKYQLPPGWKVGWFEAEMRRHPAGGAAIRFVGAERPRALHRSSPPAVGVWSTETGKLIHLVSDPDSGAADAQWTRDGHHLLVAAEVTNVETGKEDIEVTVYTWPALGIASEVRLGPETTGDDTSLHLASSSAYGAVMRAFPGFCQEFAVFTQPVVERVARFTTEESLPLGAGVFSPDDQYAVFLVMHWWSSEDERLAGRTTEPIVWATLHLVHLGDRRCSQHPVFVRPPRHWQPGRELEEAANRLARAPHTVRFEDARTLVFDLPWGGEGRVSIPPPPEGVLVPAPTVATPESTAHAGA